MICENNHGIEMEHIIMKKCTFYNKKQKNRYLILSLLYIEIVQALFLVIYIKNISKYIAKNRLTIAYQYVCKGSSLSRFVSFKLLN